MRIPHLPTVFLTHCEEKNAKQLSARHSMMGASKSNDADCLLICRCASRVGEGDQFADGILLLGKRDLRFRVEDCEHSPAVNSSQIEAVGVNAHYPIFLVEN